MGAVRRPRCGPGVPARRDPGGEFGNAHAGATPGRPCGVPGGRGRAAPRAEGPPPRLGSIPAAGTAPVKVRSFRTVQPVLCLVAGATAVHEPPHAPAVPGSQPSARWTTRAWRTTVMRRGSDAVG